MGYDVKTIYSMTCDRCSRKVEYESRHDGRSFYTLTGCVRLAFHNEDKTSNYGDAHLCDSCWKEFEHRFMKEKRI